MSSSSPARRRRRLVRVLIVCAALAVLVLASGLYVVHRLAGQLDRVPGAFSGLAQRPPSRPGVTSMLMVVEDAAEPRVHSWLPGHGTGTAVLLVRLAADRRSAVATALPVDAAVPGAPAGRQTVGDVLAGGTPAALVATVERLSRVRVDHLAVVDLAYFRDIAEHLSGLDLGRTWVSPDDTVAAFRDGRGGLRQVRAENRIVSRLVEGTLHQELRSHPVALWRSLDLFTRHAAVDDGWTTWGMAGFVVSLRNLRSADIHFTTAPVSCADRTQRCTLLPASRGGRWRP